MFDNEIDPKELIRRMEQNLYPAIRDQFLLVLSYWNNFPVETSQDHEEVYELLVELKCEFQSFAAHEIKFVFPGILNALEYKKHSCMQAEIKGMLDSGRKREKRLFDQVIELKKEIQNSGFNYNENGLGLLIQLFQNEFLELRYLWCKIINSKLIADLPVPLNLQIKNIHAYLLFGDKRVNLLVEPSPLSMTSTTMPFVISLIPNKS